MAMDGWSSRTEDLQQLFSEPSHLATNEKTEDRKSDEYEVRHCEPSADLLAHRPRWEAFQLLIEFQVQCEPGVEFWK